MQKRNPDRNLGEAWVTLAEAELTEGVWRTPISAPVPVVVVVVVVVVVAHVIAASVGSVAPHVHHPLELIVPGVNY